VPLKRSKDVPSGTHTSTIVNSAKYDGPESASSLFQMTRHHAGAVVPVVSNIKIT
jgi:hypothetical protein